MVGEGGVSSKEGGDAIRQVAERDQRDSDAARPRRGESGRHIWHCRFDLPVRVAVPPQGRKRSLHDRWGFLWETSVATKQGYRFGVSRPHPALKWQNASLI